jgi:hypothetical protein
MKSIKLLFFLFFSLIHANCLSWEKIDLQNMKQFIFVIKDTGKPDIVMHSTVEFCIHDKIIFARASLLNGKIIVYDCIGTDTLYTDQISLSRRIEQEFIGRTLKAFLLIRNNPIGNKLLSDIYSASTAPVVIFPHDFLLKHPKIERIESSPVELITKSDPAEKRVTRNLREILLLIDNHYNMPFLEPEVQAIENINFSCAIGSIRNFWSQRGKDFFPPDVAFDLFDGKNQESKLISFINAISRSQFVPTSENGVCRNMICIRFQETIDPDRRQLGFLLPQPFDLLTFSTSGTELELNIILQYDDTSLFHELNHCRHFLLKFPTIKEDKSPKWNRFASASSLKIMSDKPGIMQDPEEELQLTGITTLLEMGGYIMDSINETHYRILSRYLIRFPYRVLPEHRPMRALLKDEVVLLLKSATLIAP